MSRPVLLHGFTGSSASWEGVVGALTARRLEPALVDLPGHGLSAGEADAENVSLPAALDRIAAAGTWPADLVGYSMGGRIALHFAVLDPGRVRRLVLESSSPGLADAEERAARVRADEALARRIREDGVEAFVDAWERLPLFRSQSRLPKEVAERQRRRRLANRAEQLAAALLGLGTGALPSLWDRLGEISAPTLIVAGAEDHKFVEIASRMDALLPNSTVVIVPEAGHAVHLERPDAWAESVAGFLG